MKSRERPVREPARRVARIQGAPGRVHVEFTFYTLTVMRRDHADLDVLSPPFVAPQGAIPRHDRCPFVASPGSTLAPYEPLGPVLGVLAVLNVPLGAVSSLIDRMKRREQ
jgi:hypothetical protein